MRKWSLSIEALLDKRQEEQWALMTIVVLCLDQSEKGSGRAAALFTTLVRCKKVCGSELVDAWSRFALEANEQIKNRLAETRIAMNMLKEKEDGKPVDAQSRVLELT